jgi:hypothetical protein
MRRVVWAVWRDWGIAWLGLILVAPLCLLVIWTCGVERMVNGARDGS